jgi:ribosomal silencing factor RsfS
MDIKKQLLAEKQKNIKKLDNQNIKTVKDFIILFKNLNNREPMEIEIIDNLKDKLSVDIIKKVLDENVIISLKNDSFDNAGDMV